MLKIKLFLILILSACVPIVFAEVTVGDLSKENSEAVLWKAKSRAAQAKSDYQKNARINGVGDDVEPIVKFVASSNGHSFATLVYPGDVTAEVSVGDVAPGRYKMKVIQEDRVEAIKDGRTISFVFGKSSGKSSDVDSRNGGGLGAARFVNQ